MTDNIEGKKELKSNNQEAFCKYIAIEQKTQYEAYCLAYPNQANSKRTTIEPNITKLMKHSKIITRIDYLKATLTNKVIEKFAKSKDDILRKLETLIDKIEDKDTEITDSVAISQVRECLKEQAKLLGYYEDKLNIKGEFDLAQGIRDYKNRISQYPEYNDTNRRIRKHNN